MKTGIWDAIQQWLWPQYVPADHQRYFIQIECKPQPRVEREKSDPHTQFVGHNPTGNVMKATPLAFKDDNSTEFSTIRAFAKGKAVEANVVSHLTSFDLEELARRKPSVPQATAEVFKATYASKNGNTTADEMAMITGFSKSYAATSLASFRAALSRERGESVT